MTFPTPRRSPRIGRRRSGARLLALAAATVSIGVGGALAAPFGAGLQRASAAPEATFEVTTNGDDGAPGTLRWAMDQANGSPGEDLVEIGAVGTITLTSPLPATTESVTIQGPGMDDATIDGDGHRIFQLSAPQRSTRFLDVADLTISGAPALQGGLLLKQHGNSTFDRVRITDNSGEPSIHNLAGGILTIRESLVTGNTGNVVHSDHGNTPLTTVADSGYTTRTYISDTTFTDNESASCVVRTERFLEMVDTTFTDNDADALCVRGLNRSYVSSTTITGNTGDGIQLFSWGDEDNFQNAIQIDDVLVYDNGGAGVTGDFYGLGLPRPADELLVSHSVVFGNLGGDVTGAIYESNPTNLADNVIGIPRAPRTVTGVAGNGGVTVSWQEPSFDSGSPVTSYTATASPGGATCTSATTSCPVVGLANGTAYTFEVVATNARGDSWSSIASDPVTPDPSSPPPTTAPPTTAPPTTAPPTTAPPNAVPPTTGPGLAAPTTPAPTTPAPGDPSPQVLTALPMGLDVPPLVRPGQTITVTGSGFVPGETVRVIMMSEPVVLAEVAADGDGVAVAMVTIPLAATVGEHHLYMYGMTSRTGIGGLTQVAADGTAPAESRPAALAFTGAGSTPLLALALALVALGVALQVRGVRRPTR